MTEYFKYSELELKSLEWWNSLDSKNQSILIDEYYIKDKIGLNLQEIVKLYKKQNGISDTVKRKRERIKVSKINK